MTESRACRQCGAVRGDDDAGELCAACRGVAVAPTTAAVLTASFPSLEVLGLLGQGGMGTVYKARQLKLDRVVALKILSPAQGDDGTFAERFLREARALARLSHPHVVTVHDFGEAGELFYFVMEYVEGGSLRHLLRTARPRPAEALGLVIQTCDAIQYAHEEGVVHRDVKPENVLLDRRGRVKVADFGLAKLLGAARPGYTLTGSQQVMGTPHYMAPEQWEKAHAVDHRADVYALGVVLYELLTGELPLGRFAVPSQLVAVDPRLDDVVLKALEKDPAKRYQQVGEMKADLEAIAAGRAGELPNRAAPIAADTQTRVRDAGSSEPTLTTGHQLTRGPALGLMAAGLTSIVSSWIFAVMVSGWSRSTPTGSILLAVVLLGFPFGAVTALAGWKLWRLDTPELTFIGSVLAMVPLGPAWGLGLPMGIWVLLVLRKPEVQAAFAAPKPARVSTFNWARLIPRTTIAWGVICSLVGAAPGAFPWVAGGSYTAPLVGVQTGLGFATTALLLGLVVALLAFGRTTLAGGRSTARAVFRALGVVFPLAGVGLILFAVLLFVVVGLPGGAADENASSFAVLVAIGLLLLATLALHRIDWRTGALGWVGLAVIVFAGTFLAQGLSRATGDTLFYSYLNDGRIFINPSPAVVVACGVALVGLAALRSWNRRALS